MAVWETEDESTPPPAASLPTPADTPYRTPSRSSRKSRRSVTPPLKSSSPPPMPADRSEKGSKRSSRDVTNDETISILDPRRFTPTLHANLVSEILALRRDQEDKIKIIESLESSLHTTREESESHQESMLTTAKENRSLKRQLALLEGGTSSALGELARERDEAVDTASETKKRLDAAQKKLRSGEEDSERVHDQWAKEKYMWEEERRKYERKIHITESRLKVLLDEISAYQANHINGQDAPESELEESAKDNDAASTRTMSITNSIRFSTMSGVAKPNGHSLADELNFDGDYDDETDYGGRESVLSNNNRHIRNNSRDSAISRTHRRNQSGESLMRPGSVARGRLGLHHSTLERLEGDIIQEDDESQLPATKLAYTDTGIQFSPPPSPKLVPAKPSTPEPPVISQRFDRGYDIESPPRGEWEIEANQRRKRVHISRPLSIEPPSVTSLMVNGSCQTAEEPLSPPKTPKSPYQEAPPTPMVIEPPTLMVTTSTQTDIPPPLDPSSFGIPAISIPSISIIPPTSRPTTPREPRLPQLFKDFGCQVNIITSVKTESVAIQTEEIRIDRRLDRLPAHLHPSAVTSRPTSPAAPKEHLLDEAKQFTPVPGNVPPRNPRRLAAKSSFPELPSSPPIPSPIQEETRDAYPGNNDDGPLSGQRAPMRRPHRISSLFAGFDGGSSDEVDEFGDAELSDSEYRTALSAPRPKAGAVRQGKRSSGGVATSPEQMVQARSAGARSSMRIAGTEVYSSYALPEGAERWESTAPIRPSGKAMSRSSLSGPSNRAGVMRKAAMIQNSIVTHQRARSPSLTDPKEPPFPIPTRASSRKPPISVSAPSDGRASPTRHDGWPRRGGSRSHYRANSIRKVRSAVVLPRGGKSRRRGSRSPPPFSPAESSPPSPDLPPLPNNDITTPRNQREINGRYRAHQSQPSTNTANTGDTGLGSVGSGNQATSVVDSIAQTMIGEWMFKYVRRRKSFGVADAKGGDDNSNDRHKRWVWLAPYERAILWSSKQPSSGSALMGKSGRKLTIQSVLDVKDDNPPPKGSGPVFNRSILILTPQRALKFTAVSAERHYVWLTSLSFLAHSQQAIPEIVAPLPPPKPIPEQFALPPPAKLRRPGIRDSIRLAKGKTGITRSGPVSIASSQNDSVPPSIPTYRPTVPEPFPSLPSHQREISRDVAEPPHIPRFHDRASQVTLHGRKRSNTGGHVPPPLSFRGFSGPIGNGSHHAATNSTAGNSVGTAGSSDIYNNSQASSGNITWAVSTTGSVRTSEASSRPSGTTMNNFFDAIGTVRMEAFISPLAFTPFEESIYEQDEMRSLARRRSKELRRRASRSRHRDSYQSRGTRATDDTEDWYVRDDPFKGF